MTTNKERKRTYVINEKYQVQDDYLYYINDDNKEKIGRNIWIEKVIQNIDTKIVKVIVAFPFNNTIQKLVVDRSDITESGLTTLTKYGADTWRSVVKHYLTVLKMELERTPVEFEHSAHGWSEFQGELVFKHHKAIGIESNYAPNGRYDLQPAGTYEGWLEVIEQEVLGRRWLEFGLVLGFAPCLLALLARAYPIFESVLVCFVGESSKGKTITTQLALSPWGSPLKEGKGLLTTWYGTYQGIMDNLKNIYGIPVGIDDTSLIHNDEMDITEFVYQFTNSTTKQALHSDGTRREQHHWKTIGITSSEVSMLSQMENKSGIRVRFIEIGSEKFTESAENAENIKKGISENYGHAGLKFAKYLYDMDIDELYNMVEQSRKYLLQYIKPDSLAMRRSNTLALILATAQLVRESLEIPVDMEMLTNTLLTLERDSEEERNVAEKAMDFLCTHFHNHRGLYFKERSSTKSVGKYVEKNGEIVELRYLPANFEKVLKSGKFHNPKQIISEFMEKGWLVHDKGKLTLTRVYAPGTPREPMYAIKFIGSQENTRDDEATIELDKVTINVEVVLENELKRYSKDVIAFPFDREIDRVQRATEIPLDELAHLKYRVLEKEVVDDEGNENIEVNETVIA